MKKVIFFRKMKDDFIFYNSYIQVIADKILEEGNELHVYDVRQRKLMNFNTRETIIVLPLPTFLNNIGLFRNCINIFALFLFAIKNKGVYNHANFMYCRLEFIILGYFVLKISKINYLTIFGNSFRHSKLLYNVFPYFIMHVDKILISNREHRNRVVEYMQETHDLRIEDKTEIMPFPMPSIDIINSLSLEYINRINLAFGIYEDDIVVIVGTNLSKNEQHIDVVSQLAGIVLNDNRKLVFVFPLSYSENDNSSYSGEVISFVKEKLSDFKLIFIVDYLDFNQMLAIRTRANIFINMRKSDQFSASMMESLVSETYIITGNWLPYWDFIKINKITCEGVDSISQLGDRFKTVINNELFRMNLKHNRDAIIKYYDNNGILNNWICLFS